MAGERALPPEIDELRRSLRERAEQDGHPLAGPPARPVPAVLGGRHLHRDDYPATLELLAGLVGHREDAGELGWWPTEDGAYVDWDLLVDGKLSSTEVAVARIAQGCATLERAGGPPPKLALLLRQVLAVIGGEG